MASPGCLKSEESPGHPWSLGKGRMIVAGMSHVCPTPYKYAQPKQGPPGPQAGTSYKEPRLDEKGLMEEGETQQRVYSRTCGGGGTGAQGKTAGKTQRKYVI